MPTRTLRAETTAEAYLDLLKDRGIDVFLGNAGTDFASLVEAFARFEAEGRPAPARWWCPTSSSRCPWPMATTWRGGRPAAVMVHVNVGHRERVDGHHHARPGRTCPILMSAGRTPITEEGLPGSRDLHIHWAQESFDQAAMLREYVEVGLRAAHARAARVGGRPGARDDAGRAAAARCISRCRARCWPPVPGR